jgi:hypothetical protein
MDVCFPFYMVVRDVGWRFGCIVELLARRPESSEPRSSAVHHRADHAGGSTAFTVPTEPR